MRLLLCPACGEKGDGKSPGREEVLETHRIYTESINYWSKTIYIPWNTLSMNMVFKSSFLP